MSTNGLCAIVHAWRCSQTEERLWQHEMLVVIGLTGVGYVLPRMNVCSLVYISIIRSPRGQTATKFQFK